MCDQSLKLSEVAPITAPPKNYPNFHTCVAAHHVDKFGKVIPFGPKVIRPNTRNCAPIFEFLLSFTFFGGHPNSPTYCSSFGKVCSDRSRELGDFTPKSCYLVTSKIFRVRFPQFRGLHNLLRTLPIMCESFSTIGRGSSEI